MGSHVKNLNARLQLSHPNVWTRLAHVYWNSGVTLIVSAAFLFSCTTLAVKLNHGELPTFQLVLVPGLLCFLATTVVVKSCSLSLNSHSWRVTLLILLRGMLGAASIILYYLAIELLPLQDAVTLFFCSPVVASLLEFAITGESHGWAGAGATACTVLGVVLVSQPECVFGHGHHHPDGGARPLPAGSGTSAAGVALATAAAVANAAAFVVVRLINRAASTLVLTWWYHGVVVLVSAVPLALRYPAPAVAPSPRGWALLGAVGATQLAGQLLLNRGFQLESATRGSAINVLQVLFSLLWDVAVLGDKPGLVGLAGSSLVAAGVVVMAATGPNRPPDHISLPSEGDGLDGPAPPPLLSADPEHADSGSGAPTSALESSCGGRTSGSFTGTGSESRSAGVRVSVDADVRAAAWLRLQQRAPDGGGEAVARGGDSGGGGECPGEQPRAPPSRRGQGAQAVAVEAAELRQPLLRQQASWTSAQGEESA